MAQGSQFAEQNRFLPLGPRAVEPDETTSSWIERAALVHGVSFLTILHKLPGACENWDTFEKLDFELPKEWAQLLEDAAGLSSGSFQSIPAQSQERYQLRTWSYCPLCYHEDLAKCIIPYKRMAWRLAGLSGCTIHQCPLYQWYEEDESGWSVLPESWGHKVFGIDSDHPEFIQRRKHWQWRVRRFNGTPRLSWKEHLARENLRIREKHLLDARNLAYVLDPGKGASQEAAKESLLWEEWRTQLIFELELTAMRPVRDSVLRELGPGNWEPFVSDLYSLLTTRFYSPSELSCMMRQFSGLHRPSFQNLYAEWPAKWSMSREATKFAPVDWRYAPSERSRRYVLKSIRRILEDYFDYPAPKHEIRGAPPEVLNRELAAELVPREYPRGWGWLVMTSHLMLNRPQELDWFWERFETWPRRLRLDLEDARAVPVRNRITDRFEKQPE